MKSEKRKGASLIFVNRKEEVLLLLRDDIPSIPYPNMWDVPGGHVEPGESPRACIVREMEEELGLRLEEVEFYGSFEFEDRIEFTYWVSTELDPDEIQLTEGQAIRWFSRAEIDNLQLAYGFNHILEAFYLSKPFRGRGRQ